jgi:hypothetical protein
MLRDRGEAAGKTPVLDLLKRESKVFVSQEWPLDTCNTNALCRVVLIVGSA